MTSPGRLDPAELSASSRSAGLWQAEDQLRLVATHAVSFVMMVLAWYQVSRSDGVQDRLSWLTLGMVGVITSGVGNGIWLLRGRRIVGLARVRVLPDLPPRARAQARVAPIGPVNLVAAAGQQHYHRSDCAFVAGRDIVSSSRSRHTRAGREPCAICKAGDEP